MPMPADFASGGIMLFTVTEPVPVFAEPTGSPGAARMIPVLVSKPQPADNTENAIANAMAVLDMVIS